jgi:uncharacterized protein
MKSAIDVLAPDAAARITAYRRALDRALPGGVEAVVLFGSRARGDAGDDSDYDLAVLLRGDLARRRDVRDKVADAAFGHVVAGYALIPPPLPQNYLRPVEGYYRTKLARRIAREGALVPWPNRKPVQPPNTRKPGQKRDGIWRRPRQWIFLLRPRPPFTRPLCPAPGSTRRPALAGW